MSELLDFIDNLSVGKDGRVVPVISLEELPEKYVKTVFDNGVASIDMIVPVLTPYGTVFFEGYIRGEYVPYSKCGNIHVTALRVNEELRRNPVE